MFDLDTLTCSHVRLHEAQVRAARAQLWLILPLAVGVFALMAWWADPGRVAAYAPWALLASLLMIAAVLGYALIKGHEAGSAARELSAFHNQVLIAKDDHECEDPNAHTAPASAG